MDQKILMKNEIGKLYIELAEEYNFYAPVINKGNLIYNKILNPDEIILDFYNSKIPPKEILFPKMETLFEYKTDGKNIEEIIERKDLDEYNIIFGIRPCDAQAFMLMENFFALGDIKDNLFLKKKENTVLIGIGCNIPKSTCFCTSVNGHPFKSDYLDIFMIDLGEKYLVEGISDKGKNMLEKLTWLSKSTKADIQKGEELSKKAEESFKTKLDVKDIEKILEQSFDHPIWTEISDICMGCGICSFLCPTCTCFDVIDENDQYNNRGRRIRIWDTCQFCLYTLHTSGHNPRDSSIERCRNRILHKFCYYPKNYDMLGCVGCGRCIQLCPVNNDLRKIIEKVNKIKEEEKVNA